MLKNACLLAKIDADPAENERHFAEQFAKFQKIQLDNLADFEKC